ncbi:MAG: acyl-CoA dehydrogenase, partial [Pseudomonadota bacterium]|nr:acyl-CoA dehydrogenase [Pseudomonadota bacterium]
TRDLSLYLRQAGPDYAKDQAAKTWLDHDLWGEGDALW